MTSATLRNIIAHAAIIVALCAGAWLTLVEPRAKRLADLEDSIQVAESVQRTDATMQEQRVTGQFRQMRARINDILNRNRTTSDSATLYRLITDIAKRHDVTVMTLNPGTPQTPVQGQVTSVSRVVFSIECDYETLIAFLRDIDELSGFLRPWSIEVSPVQRSDQHLAAAHCVYESLTFALSSDLQRIVQGSEK